MEPSLFWLGQAACVGFGSVMSCHVHQCCCRAGAICFELAAQLIILCLASPCYPVTLSAIALKGIIQFDKTWEPSEKGKKYQPPGPNYSPRCISFVSWMPVICSLQKQLYAPAFCLAITSSSSHTPIICWQCMHSKPCPIKVHTGKFMWNASLSLSAAPKAKPDLLWDMDWARLGAKTLQPFSKGYLHTVPSWKMALYVDLLSKEIALGYVKHI